VLVRVGVGDGDPSALELFNLGFGLTLDVGLADMSPKKRLDEVEQRGTEGLAVGPQQGRDIPRRRSRNAVRKNDMTADAEGRSGAGDGGRIVEGGACSHEGGGGEDTCLVQLENGAVDAWRETEVVCVDDKPRGHELRRAECEDLLPALL